MTRWRPLVLLAAAVAASSLFAGLAGADDDDDDGGGIGLARLGTYSAGPDVFDEGAAEIPAYDRRSKRLFVVNGAANVVDVLDIRNPSSPTEVGELDVSAFGSPNSVAVSDGVVAVTSTAIVSEGDDDPTRPGTVAFFTTAGAHLRTLTVGATPDMAAFTPNGDWLLIANEGEPNSYGLADSVDPEGSISVVDMRRGVAAATVRTAGFDSFDDRLAALRQSGVRIFGPSATVARDLEPEYIAVSRNSRTAWVTLQEANAIAEVDVRAAEVESIRPLGTKDHSMPGNGFDASDQGGPPPAIAPRPVRGTYMPDAIVALTRGDETYLLTANEGDVREWPGIKGPGSTTEALRAGNSAVQLDSPLPAGLNRLNITTVPGLAGGDTDGNGKIDVLQSFGARSFSVWTTSGQLVADSGDQLEQITAATPGVVFNASNTNNSFDNRSDDKGPEPEEIELGKISGRWYAFVGLERPGGVVVYDVSRPSAPRFVTYVNNRDFSVDPEDPQGGDPLDLGPEGIVFIAAKDSPTRKPLLVVANEISGTTTIYAVETVRGGDEDDDD
jgi:hypothetical protein